MMQGFNPGVSRIPNWWMGPDVVCAEYRRPVTKWNGIVCASEKNQTMQKGMAWQMIKDCLIYALCTVVSSVIVCGWWCEKSVAVC